MNPVRKCVGLACLAVTLGVNGAATTWAAPQDKPTYSLAEFNAYNAEHGEKDPQARIKLLDDFISKYGTAPDAASLIPFIYVDYYLTYNALKNYAKTIEYVDKLLALGDKVDLGNRVQAYIARAQAYAAGSGDKAFQTPEAYTKARETATQGLQTFGQFQKPANMTDEQFATLKKSVGILINDVAGISASGLKDYKAAAESYKAEITFDPNAPVAHFRLGVAYVQEMPPDAQNGYWELARSIALKGPGEAQVRTYLRNQLLHYQQPSCEKLVDDQMNQMITLAGTSAERPSSMTIPSADDLQKARDNVAEFLPWLQEGGEHAKTMWLATCGLEYPDVPVRVMEIAPGDNDAVTLKVYRPAATDPDAQQKEMDAATMPNMEVHVAGQPDVKRVQKDDAVRFTGTLSAYQQSPFLLTWDNAKVNPEDLQPAATPGAKRPAPRSAAPKAAAPKKPGV
jgi:tetratricopeptide (TPR) repeat protein